LVAYITCPEVEKMPPKVFVAERMDMDIDKSEDELELERFVFGDADGIKQRLKGGKDIEHAIQKTDLEHLENDQVLGGFAS
jgi:hypothetical protein